LRPEPVPEPPPQREDGLLALMGRFVNVAALAALIALLIIFGKPLLQRVAVLEPDTPSKQVSKPSDPLTANDAPANRAFVPAAGTPSAAPPATAQAQQAPLSQGQQASLSSASNPLGRENSVNSVRGVTDSEIRFGISAPFTGPAKELGQNMKLGIETAFNVTNANGGVHGRQLRLVAVDDGYEPARAAVGTAPVITLGEEEISDVSLATFYVFDNENAGAHRPGLQLAKRTQGHGGDRGRAVNRGCGGCGSCGGCASCASSGGPDGM
jgi:Periplasmic binding protein